MEPTFVKYCYVALSALIFGSTYAKSPIRESYLVPQIQPGQTYSNVFSISRSVKADGFDELVRRNGGSADYSAMGSSAGSWSFRATSRYDGQPLHQEVGYFRDGGRSYCVGHDCNRYSDASGLLYNPALWGTPLKRMSKGMSWTVDIAEPWELGGANSRQTVTVILADPISATVILMREGTSNGPFDNESTHIQLGQGGQSIALELVPGAAHWTGYATFRQGVVISDELVVTRTDVLRGSDGREYPATERRIMLLNASPSPKV
jgi:hypothetical protein